MNRSTKTNHKPRGRGKGNLYYKEAVFKSLLRHNVCFLATTANFEAPEQGANSMHYKTLGLALFKTTNSGSKKALNNSIFKTHVNIITSNGAVVLRTQNPRLDGRLVPLPIENVPKATLLCLKIYNKLYPLSWALALRLTKTKYSNKSISTCFYADQSTAKRFSKLTYLAHHRRVCV